MAIDTSMARGLATVTQLRPNPPRELTYQQHWAEPPHVQAVAHLGWAVEQQLIRLHDQGQAPATVLGLFPSDRVEQAVPALEWLFDCADAARAAEDQHPEALPLSAAVAAYESALLDLTQILQGVRASVDDPPCEQASS